MIDDKDILPPPPHFEQVEILPPLNRSVANLRVEDTKSRSSYSVHGIDIGAVITKALEAAGLMKRN